MDPDSTESKKRRRLASSSTNEHSFFDSVTMKWNSDDPRQFQCSLEFHCISKVLASCTSASSFKISLADYLYRNFLNSIAGHPHIRTDLCSPTQFVVDRGNLVLDDSTAIILFSIFTPFEIENEMGSIEDVAKSVNNALQSSDCLTYCKLIEDQIYLRNLVLLQGLAFVANGSILARTDRVSDTPLKTATPFQSPSTLQREFNLPHSGVIRGMLIPRGVTVITGGGFHGKSTLLRALATGVFNKVPGDGREFVVIDSNSVCIRAEDGRYVHGVDVSPFIGSLPTVIGINPEYFMTTCASGSTSQASNIIEMIEIGMKTLLLDEDTCASNFMVRDSRMRAMVAHEPITPFIYRVNSLWLQFQISTIVVIGGNGDWFDVQDCTILLDNYICYDATKKALSISKTFSHGRVQYNGRGLVHRLPWPWTVLYRDRYPIITKDIILQEHKINVTKEGLFIYYGSILIDLSRLELVISNEAISLGIALAVQWICHRIITTGLPDPDNNGDIISMKSLGELLDIFEATAMNSNELLSLTRSETETKTFTFIRPRRADVGAAINRLRGMKFKYTNDSVNDV
eukprot:gene7262-14807_t